MTTDDRELLDELRRLSQALSPFADSIFAGSLSVAEQLDCGDQLIKIAARIRERATQKPYTTHRRFTVKAQGLEAPATFYIEACRGKGWITTYDCPRLGRHPGGNSS